MKKIYSVALIYLGCIFGLNAQAGTWTALVSGTSIHLLGVLATDPSTCYVCGNNGLIRKTTDGGTTWNTQTTGTAETLVAFYFTDANNGYCIGDNGTGLKTTNAGTTWTPMNTGTVTEEFRGVYFTDVNTGYITGGISTSYGSVRKTTNAGATWTNLTVSASNVIYGSYFSTSTTGMVACYDGTTYRTTDGGSSWNPSPGGFSNTPPYLAFVNPMDGILVTDSGVIRKTTDSGIVWNSVLSGVTDNLMGIDFYDANNGFVTGGNVSANSGLILRTTDGGINWTPYLPGSARLTKVDIVDMNTGYATGLDGTILKYTSTKGFTENEVSLISFNSFPNPFNTSCTIDCSGYIFEEKSMLELYDLSGKLVKMVESNDGKTFSLEKGGLSAGSYFFKVLDGQKYIGQGKTIIE